MRCSSFEPLLDEFVDGTLTPVRTRRVAKHVADCTECSALLAELRVVDALLLTARPTEPVANFTFKAMAEIRSMRAPHVHRTPILSIASAYLVFAWTAIGFWFTFGGPAARGVAGMLLTTLGDYGDAVAGLASVTGHVFGHMTPGITALMAGILLFDFVATAAVAVVYCIVRPRLAAHLAHSWETR
jgi:anti-sigma factor RsiW